MLKNKNPEVEPPGLMLRQINFQTKLDSIKEVTKNEKIDGSSCGYYNGRSLYRHCRG
jgi:hypothetical protein